MKFSIVTVVLNNPQVGEALDSILEQAFDGELELIVIDGGSTDGTLAVLEGYKDRLALLVSEADGGIYHGMNRGLAAATGDVVGTLNSDDLYYDGGALAAVAEAFENAAVDAVYGDLVYVRRDDTRRVVRTWTSRPYEAGLFERGWMPPHPAFFARREVYARHGAFDLAFRLAADFELLARLLAKEGIRTRHLPRTLVRMRLGGASNRSLGAILRANLECVRACRKLGLKIPPWFIPRKLLSKVPQFFRAAPGAPR
ncbi:MAG: glycosyltransferase [Holophagaceae bacterium]|nr:glycosyltransferase [Holophagaceae bacterium]